ncbi:MAG TPA: metal ABC transporter ATP-binding protein [Acidimicrobiia bacterium]|nr:metal ABC transporter ATP-binding protein [Acidimicrobiia bacterium]
MPVRPVAVRGKDLILAYGPNIALAASSFEIPRGGITILIGPNGSGKSTLLGAMAGLIDPIGGSIEVLGPDGWEQRISYVLQSTKVNDTLPVTVREVVTMGRYAGSKARRLGAGDQVAVDEAMRRMGISHLAGRHLRELSGGQRQRVLVAQGLAQEHELLLLDEPLTGLDLTSAQAIDNVIHDETQTGCTIVMTTHDLAEAQVADHVVLLSGRVVASGAAEEVLTVENLTAAYGPNLLHVEGERLFIDDPAHRPVPGRHDHRDRSG